VGLKPISVANWLPSVLWRCWLGHLACKNRPEMTYKASSGTLNLCSLTHSLTGWQTDIGIIDRNSPHLLHLTWPKVITSRGYYTSRDKKLLYSRAALHCGKSVESNVLLQCQAWRYISARVMSKEPVVDQAVNTLRRGMPFVQNGIQFTLDTAVSSLEHGTICYCFVFLAYVLLAFTYSCLNCRFLLTARIWT